MSPCSGEPMPVVVSNFRILSSPLCFAALPALFVLALAGVLEVRTYAQESATPAAEAVPGEAPVVDGAVAPATSAVAGDEAYQYVLNQQKLTRSIREIRKPLPSLDKAAAEKIKRQYTQLLGTGFSGEADTKIVRDYLTWLIFQATDPTFCQSSKNMENLIEDVKNSVTKAGSNAQGGQAGKDRERRKYCSEVLSVSKQLLDNNLDARFAALKIMQFLYDTIPAQSGGATSMIRLHPESLTVMLACLNDPNQPDSVKAVAAGSLKNILMNCDVVEQDQFRISDAIYKEILRPYTEAAFQLDLIDAAYLITKPRRTVGTPEPTALKIFAAVINDRTKPVEVRCHAAKGFGICNYDVAGTKFEPIAWKVTQLAFDAAAEYNQNPGNPKWQWCGIDLLLTFRHLTVAEATAAPPACKGIMNRAPNSKVVSEAAPFVTAVSLHFIANKGKFAAGQIGELTKMKTWLTDNTPADLKWDTNAPPLQK